MRLTWRNVQIKPVHCLYHTLTWVLQRKHAERISNVGSQYYVELQLNYLNKSRRCSLFSECISIA